MKNLTLLKNKAQRLENKEFKMKIKICKALFKEYGYNVKNICFESPILIDLKVIFDVYSNSQWYKCDFTINHKKNYSQKDFRKVLKFNVAWKMQELRTSK